MECNEAKRLLASVSRISLGFYPTPFYRLERLSEVLGINLYIKRDDFSGKNLFGGNKTRKLEFLLGKALAEQCDCVFTYGATQSNHAMQTAWACAANGLKPILYLAAVVEPNPDDIRANLLLDRIYGAELHIVSTEKGESFLRTEERSFRMGEEHIRRLEREGHRCCNIPVGGADAVGTLGYLSGMIELCEQTAETGLTVDHLYHASGSGGTMAGLTAGKKLLGESMTIHSVMAFETDQDYAVRSAALASEALRSVGADIPVSPEELLVDEAHYLPGYECPSEGGTEAVRLLAAKEGLLVDPVYSGKALAGLISDVRAGKVAQGSTVVFLHTGGTTALFAEKQILGDIL